MLNRLLEPPGSTDPKGFAPPRASPTRASPGQAAPGPQAQLLDAMERLARTPVRPGWLLLVLHLSHLPDGGPAQRRVAAATLEREAEGTLGRVFLLPDGDLALLARLPAGPAAMLARLAALFGPTAAPLHAVFPLPAASHAAAAHLRARRAPPTPPPARVPADPADPADAVAIHLRPGAAHPVQPLFRIVAGPDKFHGAARALSTPLPVHVRLSAAEALGAPFAELLGHAGPRLGAAIPVIDAVRDPARLRLAHERLRLAGATLTLTGLHATLLPLLRPGTLEPDWIELPWSPAGPAPPRTLDPERIVLAACTTEAAIRWGRAHGIARFAGPFIDGAHAALRAALQGTP